MEEDSKSKGAEARSFIANRQRAYIATFEKDAELNMQVLSDLAKFCRADRSTFHEDPRIHAVLEGRREVWLRIQNHLKLDTETLWQIFNRRGV